VKITRIKIYSNGETIVGLKPVYNVKTKNN